MNGNLRLVSQVKSAFLKGLLTLLPLVACRASSPDGPLVLTQIPAAGQVLENAPSILDLRYPKGSRVVLAQSPLSPSAVRILSKGLDAAGNPVASADGKRIYFAGKKAGLWQIYETAPDGGVPKPMTSMEGGAMDPAIIAHGSIVFSSPVPKAGETWKPGKPASLYSQSPGNAPRRLTYGISAAVEPTVLRDGRILFVSASASEGAAATPNLGLYTVNNDGSEVAAFALDQDGAPSVHRPRELLDGRVGWVAASDGAQTNTSWAEAVRMARPFLSRQRLFSFAPGNCRSVEPDGNGAILACLETQGQIKRSLAVYRIEPDAKALGTSIFDDPAWDDIEAISLVVRPEPMGRISALNMTNDAGTILCMNANFTRPSGTVGASMPKAEQVRVLVQTAKGGEAPLGEVRLHPDGSFLVKVPADVPIGFETMDNQGRVIWRLPPSMWVRPGENRSCLGCHEPYNRSPRNHRPMAVALPPLDLSAHAKAIRTP
jgi:hypothetical protein